MKRGTPNHIKTKRLMRRCRIDLIQACGALELLWHTTARLTPRGDIGKYPDTEIEEEIGWTGEPGVLIDGLLESGWIDKHPVYRLIVHDWHDHADDSVKKLLKRHGWEFVTTEQDLSDPVPDVSRQVPDMSRNIPDMDPLPKPKPCHSQASPEPEPGPARPKPEPVPGPSQAQPSPSAMRTQEEGASSSKARCQPSPRPKIRNINGDTCELEINGKLERMPMRQAQELLERIESLEMAAEVGA